MTLIPASMHTSRIQQGTIFHVEFKRRKKKIENKRFHAILWKTVSKVIAVALYCQSPHHLHQSRLNTWKVEGHYKTLCTSFSSTQIEGFSWSLISLLLLLFLLFLNNEHTCDGICSCSKSHCSAIKNYDWVWGRFTQERAKPAVAA